MEFVALLLVLWIDQRMPQLRQQHFADMAKQIMTDIVFRLPQFMPGSLLVAMFAVVYFVAALQAALVTPLYFLLMAISLWLVLGERDLQENARQFVQAWESGERANSRQYASAILGTTVDQNTPDLSRELFRSMVLQVQQRFFAIVFWLVVAGPAGAIAYRLSHLATIVTKERSRVPLLLERFMAWPVSFTTALLFGIAGVMGEQWLAAMQKHHNHVMKQNSLLVETAMAALQLQNSHFSGFEAGLSYPLQQLLNLLRRSFAVMFVVLLVVGIVQWM